MWPKRQRRVVEPVVRPALEQVEGVCEDLGLDFREQKTVNVWRCARSEDTWGVARDVTQIDLHIRTDHIKHRKVVRFFDDLTKTVGHELLHTIREEYFVDDGPIERVASEGLAYSGEDLIEVMCLGGGEGDLIGEAMLRHAKGARYDAVKARLVGMRDHRWPQAMLDNVADDPQRVAWFEMNGNMPPAGVLIGVVEVQRRLSEGNDFAQIMTWPAEEILNLR